MDKFVIGICSIGSGVGQSVIDSCKLFKPGAVQTVGLGNTPSAFGATECDRSRLIPGYHDDGYIERLIEVAAEENITLLIPGHDDEAYVLAKNREKLGGHGIGVLAAPEALIAMCRDKYSYTAAFQEAAPFFVRSYTYQQLLDAGEDVFPLIRKPRSGYASKSISVIADRRDLTAIDDDGNHIYQEIAMPASDDELAVEYRSSLLRGENRQVSEISLQLIFDQSSTLQVCCATTNRLANGVPIEIFPLDPTPLNPFIEAFCRSMRRWGAFGPINVQGRMTDAGFKVFEINPRFTGITGLRAKLGFNEVEYVVMGLLMKQPCLRPHLSSKHAGVRQVASKKIDLPPSLRPVSDSGRCGGVSVAKRVLLSGSTGLLGGLLLDRLLSENDLEVYTVDRHRNERQGIRQAYCFEELLSGVADLRGIDVVLHGAFARPHHGSDDHFAATQTSMKFLQACLRVAPAKIIFVSSQSVYGNSKDVLSEASLLRPESSYAQAKVLVEDHIKSLSQMTRETRFTIMRLSSVMGPLDALVEQEAYSSMMSILADGGEVPARHLSRRISKIDYRDAVDALLHFTMRESQHGFFDIINIGPGSTPSLEEVLDAAVERLGASYRVMAANAEEVPDDLVISSAKAHQEYGWYPRHDMQSTIDSFRK
ncbi:NAD-dependent epimerase/dehydratase family protein [Salinicola sp. DM10]|uniref:NAD-dependent epimerase/dehydratase family protein n=1 Tax=Salinicola sp. DM10 TaxID=2815721 RepID=UPI001A8C4E46|nr:NAD-dependent epimerase/dehydratase family protein [Salinicola sp. DM10]MCE3025835.1 NAD-dependent epimerase/dehydratase family protein [Salinicola sp. DM10]